MLVMKNSKRHLTDGMELPNQDKIRTLGEKEAYKYFGILQAHTIKQMEMKEYLRRTRKLLETKLYSRKLIKGINKLMTMHTVLHPTDYTCQEKKEEEDLPELKTTLMHQYNDLRTTLKTAEEYWLQPSETILTLRGPKEWQK